MIHIPFQTGGFVLHKVVIQTYKGRFSAWFDKDGNLTDAEQHLENKTRDCRKWLLPNQSKLKTILQTIGNRYKNKK